MIRVEHLTKRYGENLALDDLSFEAEPGMVTGFLGPNGAGKSTTLRILTGIDRPTSGRATVTGRTYAHLTSPLRQVGALLDAHAVQLSRTAEDHLTWLALAGGLDRRRVSVVLEQVGLSEVADRRIRGFSLGMKQRLGVAAALLGDPEVVLLDEPVNGLDADGIHWVRSLFRRLAGEGRTVFLSSHLMSEIELTADSAVVIGQGRLIRQSTVVDLRNAMTSQQVRMRSPDLTDLVSGLERLGASVRLEHDSVVSEGVDASAIGEMAFHRGIVLYELSPIRPSLEEAFIALTKDFSSHRSGPLGDPCSRDDREDEA
ncbi:MAG: type transport system ATP-binding protein [Actinomycetota bacterium]|nr:type transport system ATP-binding protein [Actinomycetota bacterium]